MSAFLFTPFFVCRGHRHKLEGALGTRPARRYPNTSRIWSQAHPVVWDGIRYRPEGRTHRKAQGSYGMCGSAAPQVPLAAQDPTRDDGQALRLVTVSSNPGQAHLHRLLWGGRNHGRVALHRLRGWSGRGWRLGGHRWGRLQRLGRHHCHDRGLDDEVWGDSRKGVRRSGHRRRVLLRGLGLRRSCCLSCVGYRGDAGLGRCYQS